MPKVSVEMTLILLSAKKASDVVSFGIILIRKIANSDQVWPGCDSSPKKFANPILLINFRLKVWLRLSNKYIGTEKYSKTNPIKYFSA